MKSSRENLPSTTTMHEVDGACHPDVQNESPSADGLSKGLMTITYPANGIFSRGPERFF
jgi:hypothetical protein